MNRYATKRHFCRCFMTFNVVISRTNNMSDNDCRHCRNNFKLIRKGYFDQYNVYSGLEIHTLLEMFV